MAKFGLLALVVFFGSSWSFADEDPLIRVRLGTSLEKIEFEGESLSIQGQASAFEFVAIGRRQKIGLQRELVQGSYVWKLTKAGHIEIFPGAYLTIRGKGLVSQGRPLPDRLIFSAQKKKFDQIAVLPLEEYLVGVIASEMPLSWPFETLKAQAIAARSYALATMKERARQKFHVESTVLDQVFMHIGNRSKENLLVSKALQAVQATRGVVLLNHKAKALKAFYHSDCGGRTSEASSVWGAGTSAGTVLDKSCPHGPQSHWVMRISENELGLKLQKHLKHSVKGDLRDLSLIRPSPKERAVRVDLLFNEGKKITISAQDFRAAIGFDQLRSTLFEVQKRTDNSFEFRGAGYGHGVGLCQWGARALGKDGKSYDEILRHYYPQAQLSIKIRQEPEFQKR